MSDLQRSTADLPPQQQAIRARCFHPSGSFIEFKKEEIEQSIPERFEKIVRLYPDRIAVKARTQTLTYDALNKMANQLAHTILARRGQGEEPIALLLESDAPMIAALLGVLKAGKIYVPLDSSLPRARLAYIIEDSKATLLITNTKNQSLARDLTRNTLVDLDELDPTLSCENPGLPISPETLTWILYTSGSTGQPKGVVQNHRNVLHFVRTYTNGFHICADDRLTLLFSYSANGAAHDTFSALLNGSSLYPFNVKQDERAQLGGWLRQNLLTIYCSVPTVFRHFMESVTGNDPFPHLRLIKLIGEPVAKRDVELYQHYFSRECVLINRLGSTETGTVRWWFIDKDKQIKGNIVPVGYAVEDNEILLVDDAGKEVGLDDIGEIAVRSRYLTPGYWQRPDLTRAAFSADPERGEERIYRTGDLGRRLPDGCLIHLGRKDFQVKVRGHRIELAEIEMALLDHPIIKEAVVVAREDHESDRRLVAYLLAAARPVPSVSELRGLLNERLPDYMIPSTWVFLEAFPRAPNGKVDRRALPDPGQSRPELATRFVLPRTPVEAALAGIWAEVLSLDQVGIHDNFFDLGGHSLKATQVMSRLPKTLRMDLSLRTLFENPTVASLAVQIAHGQARKIRPNETPDVQADLESLLDEEVPRLLAPESSKGI